MNDGVAPAVGDWRLLPLEVKRQLAEALQAKAEIDEILIRIVDSEPRGEDRPFAYHPATNTQRAIRVVDSRLPRIGKDERVMITLATAPWCSSGSPACAWVAGYCTMVQ